MKIYSTRHGQTGWNLDNRICGVTDVFLTYNGLEQAKNLAKEIKMFGNIDVIICSPLQRAIQTAQIVSDRIGVPFVIDERLTEWDYGKYEGMDRHADGFAKNKTEFGVKMGKTGESLLELAHRVYGFLDEIINNYENENILLVSHGGVCRIIETYFNDMTNDEFLNFFMGNCEVRVYEA